MKKFVPLFLLLSLCLCATSNASAQSRPRRVTQSTGNEPQTPPPATTDSDVPEEVDDGEVVRVETALVTIPVSVSDPGGRYVPDLRQEDFRVFEDGVEQRVAYFAAVEKPFTVALMIDASDSTRFRMDEIQDAAIAFVDQLRPDDRVLVISFDESVHVMCEATNDRYTLRNAIRRTHTGGGTSLYDAVDFVINRKLNSIDGRKAIVLFTDGVDTTSRRSNYQNNIYDAEQLDALIYPVQYNTDQNMNASSGRTGGRGGSNSGGVLIDILGGILGGGRRGGGGGGGGGNRRGGGGGGGGSRTGNSDYERADRYLGELAERTGARRYRADSTSDLEQSFALIAEELRKQYSLGYYPQTVAQSGQRRQIKVNVNRPNLVVRSRDSYISSQSNTATNTQDNRQQQRVPPNTRRSPLIATGQNRLR